MYKVLVLSLKSDIERRKHITQELKKAELHFEFFDAKTPEDVTDEIKQNMFNNIDIYSWDLNHDNVLATFLSHLAILEYSKTYQENILLVEDDMVLLRPFDFDSVDFSNFDIFNISDKLSCCAYFINHKSAAKILNHFLTTEITQAFDWELYKLKDKFNIRTISEPVFRQTNTFVSNLAPNGYKKLPSN